MITKKFLVTFSSNPGVYYGKCKMKFQGICLLTKEQAKLFKKNYCGKDGKLGVIVEVKI